MFLTRLLSSIVLVILAFTTISMGGGVLLAVLILLSAVAYMELSGATGVYQIPEKEREDGAEKRTVALTTRELLFRREKNGLEVVGILGIVLHYGLLLFLEETQAMSIQTGMLLSIVAVFMGSMFVYVFTFPKYRAQQVMAGVFNFLYGPFCLSFIYLARELRAGTRVDGSIPSGLFIVWLILISSWGCDTCAYCVGILIGRHKMSPVLSPKKSIEGAVGGTAGAVLLGALYGYLVRNMFEDDRIILLFAVICGVGALLSMAGDLAASAIKRNAGLKDYGTLIPGHGGVMDRFDSMIFTAPVIYFMALFLITM